MSFLQTRRVGDIVHVEHAFYGRFKFNAGATLADASAASAYVFAGERTDGQPPKRVAIKLDSGNQVYSDHQYWSELFHGSARFPGLPWILPHTLPAVPWKNGTVDMMVSELLGDSLESLRLRCPKVLDMLAAVHAAGVVHRDIKPANLLLPLEGSPPHQLHIIDFGIASKIDALGATKGQQPDGTLLLAHRGAALKHPLSFRDDLEALGYTLLLLSTGSLPWEARAHETVAKKGVAERARDVCNMKLSRLAGCIDSVAAPPLARALKEYFASLQLEKTADNAARMDYAALRGMFACAHGALNGDCLGLRFDAAAPVAAGAAGAAGGSPSQKRGRSKATAAPEAPPAVPEPKKRGRATQALAAASSKRAAAPKPAPASRAPPRQSSAALWFAM